jgi:hypothetical protein
MRQSIFVQVSNLLDQRNIYSLYALTGKWDDDGDPGTSYAHDANPKRISDGRRIVVGFNFAF